ncbi:MAG: PrsW family glutamic-type intramembrane protease [Marinilabiliaceae bacterium]|nr:PrsW family glutamic-type intramembrane protease [Marinilabiliaceae bacterium]
MILFLLILSVLPAAIILFYVYRRDKYEQEPLGLLLIAFGLGAFSTLFVFAVVSVINLIIPVEPNTDNNFFNAFVTSFAGAAIPEELLKFVMLYLLVWKNRNFNERFDGIIYSVFVSLGFATLENILYVLQNGVGVGLLRAFTAVPAHALFGVAMGYYFSYAKFLPEHRHKYITLSICVPILLHGTYNFLIFSQKETTQTISILLCMFFFAFVVFLWWQGFKKIKKMSADFYFSGIPEIEILEYINAKRGWYETNPLSFEQEKLEIWKRYPEAKLDINDGLVTFILVVNTTREWIIQLAYARNYRNLKEQLRIYLIEPDLNELVEIENSIPFVKIDMSNSYYLDLALYNPASGVKTIENVMKWIILFEKWVNEEIKIEEFVIR